MSCGLVSVIVPKFGIIDSDSILPERDWLARKAAPFTDQETAGADMLLHYPSFVGKRFKSFFQDVNLIAF